VALTYHRNRVGANTTCAQIMDDGGEARVFHADLRDPEEIRGLAAEVTKRSDRSTSSSTTQARSFAA
jgi:hypothetical protein